MQIFVPNIPSEGQKITLKPDDSWTREIIHDRLETFLAEPIRLSGNLHLFRFDKNVSLSGKIFLECHPDCGRCTKNFTARFEIPVKRHIVPHFKKESEKFDKKEVELQEEDLEFSSYYGDEINLDDIIIEEINLALPLNFYCQEACAGLCPKCGKNLNEGSCECQLTNETSPFNVLKGIQFPEK
ncbi:MAG: DUF177 domain-containing protein [Deltaproteobacteria bacterium]|nr:DUF177 domain-containing protein [Deltaproteobacteria bacterium]